MTRVTRDIATLLARLPPALRHNFNHFLQAYAFIFQFAHHPTIDNHSIGIWFIPPTSNHYVCRVLFIFIIIITEIKHLITLKAT